ncbi:ABC transporter permease [Rhizobium sp. P32RR-XVIII]|uniref:ABC transporter permease n=1 Tax=Rhizobium sp. P32RR-XVIII TaxID=2726738 RepID=UPI001456FC5B|nr:ABC transporter permease [Rhizobium sp. P32RR-XVIII]NLS03472.1 ABC transporter permease [Rhizobium sp. P32RR-XVIII]
MLLISRLLRAAVSLWVIVTLVFVALRATGDPVLAIFNPDDTTQAALDAYREQWGYTGTILQQYLTYVNNIFHGALGMSNMSNRDALAVVLERLPATLLLVGCSAVIMIVIGVPAGALAAIDNGGRLDRTIMALSTVGFALPNFVLGLALILLLSVNLHILPSNGYGSFENLIMPVLTIGLSKAAIFTRFVRSAVLDALRLTCVTSARARGLSEFRIFTHHVIPNAMLPLVTITPLLVGSMIAAGSVVESVFGWPGVGRLIVDSVAQRDLAVLQVIIMMVAFLMIATNLIVDLTYAKLDPRTALAHNQ